LQPYQSQAHDQWLDAKKSFTRDAATDFIAASLLPVVAVWQWRKVRRNVCLLLNFIPVH